MPRIALFGSVSALAYGFNGSAIEPGQIQWTTAGVYSWVVPQGMTTLCGVCVGGGGDNSGIGGGLHWRNEIPVVPGETLTIQIGTSDRFSGLPIESFVKRGTTYLLRADHGTYFSTLGGGGGNGGNGLFDSSSAGGGGAGGYMGNGGNGGNPGKPPAANSGGGRGGNPRNDGEGVGLQGRTPTFAPGSLGTPKVGGGLGEGQKGGSGGVRLMWGRNRSFPDNAADV